MTELLKFTPEQEVEIAMGVLLKYFTVNFIANDTCHDTITLKPKANGIIPVMGLQKLIEDVVKDNDNQQLPFDPPYRKPDGTLVE